jgi:hypothetical protein
MEVELLKSKCIKLKPEIIIFNYYINDMENTPKRISSLKYFLMTKFYLYGFLFNKYAQIKSKYDSDFKMNYYRNIYNKNNMVANTSALQELVDICKENNIKLLITNIPDLRILHNYPYKYANDYIRDTAIKLKTEYLDLYSLIKEENPESLWVSIEDPHANSYANKIFALAMYKKIQELNWLIEDNK